MNTAELGFVVILAVMVAFYFIFLWPLQREQRRHRKDIQGLQPGDEVLTTSGFLAVVKEIQVPETGPVQLVLDMGNGLELRALTSAIQQRVAPGQTAFSQQMSQRSKGA